MTNLEGRRRLVRLDLETTTVDGPHGVGGETVVVGLNGGSPYGHRARGERQGEDDRGQERVKAGHGVGYGYQVGYRKACYFLLLHVLGYLYLKERVVVVQRGSIVI